MKKIFTHRKVSLERSLCAGRGGVLAAAEFRADGICGVCEGPRPFNFSPVLLIQKLPTARKTPPGLRNKSDKPPRNHTSTACRWRPPSRTGRAKKISSAEFVGLKSSSSKRAGRNPSEGIWIDPTI